MKRTLSALLTLLISLIGIQNANAHAQLTSSFPGKNQIVTSIPTLIWLEFDGDLLQFDKKEVNKISVTNSKNIRVDVGGTIVGGPRISTKLKSNLTAGKYLISYRIVSEDGHPVQGSFSFIYKPK